MTKALIILILDISTQKCYMKPYFYTNSITAFRFTIFALIRKILVEYLVFKTVASDSYLESGNMTTSDKFKDSLTLKYIFKFHTLCLLHKIITEKPAYSYKKLGFRTDVHNISIRKAYLSTKYKHNV